jgi:hypothetical protein
MHPSFALGWCRSSLHTGATVPRRVHQYMHVRVAPMHQSNTHRSSRVQMGIADLDRGLLCSVQPTCVRFDPIEPSIDPEPRRHIVLGALPVEISGRPPVKASFCHHKNILRPINSPFHPSSTFRSLPLPLATLLLHIRSHALLKNITDCKFARHSVSS